MTDALDRPVTAWSLVKFTLPSMIMMVVMALYTVVDGVFVARLIGTDAFSAVNIVYPLLSAVFALGTMFGTGAATLISRQLGEGRRQEADRILSLVVLVCAGLGALLGVLSLIGLKPVLYALGANDAVYGYCRDYALPLLFFFPAGILQLAFQSLLVADGKPQIGLRVILAGGLTNIVLDYAFIAVAGMGISGAALATGIGYSLPAVYGLAHFGRGRGLFRFARPKADGRALLRVVTNGSSEMVSFLSAGVTTFLFNTIMMRHAGPDGVAAVAVLLYLDFVLVAVGLGYALGVAPLFSYNHGRGDAAALRGLYRLSILFCLGLGAGMFLITQAFAPGLTAVFADRGTPVYAMAVTGLRIFAAGYLFKGCNIFTSAMFTAFSDGKISALLAFMRTLVFLAGALLGLTALFGVDGVWFASPVAELAALILAVALTLRFRKDYRYL